MNKLLLVTIFASALTAAASVSPRHASAAGTKVVTIECFNDTNCGNTDLSLVCGSGWHVASVSCSQAKYLTGATACGGGGAFCKVAFSSPNGGIASLDGALLGELCSDASGFDAIVYCQQ